MFAMNFSALELEVNRLRSVVAKSETKLDDTAQGVGLLMEVLDTTATTDMLSTAEKRMEKRVKELEVLHSRDIQLLQRAMQEATDDRNMLSARVRAGEARMEVVAEQERKREERLAALESQVAGMAASTSLLRSNAENLEQDAGGVHNDHGKGTAGLGARDGSAFANAANALLSAAASNQ